MSDFPVLPSVPGKNKLPGFLALLMMLCVVVSAYPQLHSDSAKTHHLREVNINAAGEQKVYEGPAAVQVINTQKIKQLPVFQLSDALKYMSGVVVRDYGGTGGMKTVSVRGLGTQHTGVAYDDIAMSDCQTGQIDLSKMTLDNVGSIRLVVGADDDIFVPARLFSYSSLLKVGTTTAIPEPTFGVRVGATAGMYGFYSVQAAVFAKAKSRKHEHRQFFWNLTADLMRSKGNYPYIIRYGGADDSTSREIRKNSVVHSCNIESNAVWQIDRTQRLSLKLYYYDSDRELPPAAIFYNNESRQKLWNKNAFAQAHYHKYFNPKWAFQANAKFNYDYTRYLDPDYLNEDGFLDNKYHQTESYVSNTVMFTPIRVENGVAGLNLLQLSLSLDVFWQQLTANSLNHEKPGRLTSLSALAATISGKRWKVSANLLFSYVDNVIRDGAEIDDYHHFSPTVGGSYRIGDFCSVRAFYKNIFRMPTFNDLYYREVGNISLKPEKTHQWDAGLVVDNAFVVPGKLSASAAIDLYFNIVKDKIVAFPSHNLFTWTMLNYGKVYIGGVEVNSSWRYSISRRHSLQLHGNITFQKAIDRTEKGSKTFNHQIPYTPLLSGSVSLSWQNPWFTIGYSMIAVGKRYSLPQNIDVNEVRPYSDHSITISRDFRMNKSLFSLKAEFLNITNTHYEIIRNYPMQGFGFRFRFVYSFER